MLNYNKILFTGSNGRFGRVFKKIYKNKNYLYPKKSDFNITDIKSIERYFKKNKPNLVIHCAALSRPMETHQKNISLSITINIIGTCNLVQICEKYKVKLIYFSTGYVYPGSKGNYSEEANLKPINNYAWSKLGGECAVQMYPDSLILRICMTEKPFIHKKAFKNMKTNFIFHEEVAKILPLFYSHKGIINIGGKTQSVYNFAKKYNPNIKGINLKKLKNSGLNFNVSMNINKMKKIVNA